MIIEPPGDPTARTGRPSRVMIVGAIELRGRLPPSARFGAVVRAVVEVRQLVVEQEAVAGHDDPVAAGRLDRERVGHDEAALVGDGQVRGRRSLLGDCDGAGWPAVAAGHRRVHGLVGDQRAPLGGERIRQQAVQRHVHVVRIAEVLVAVGERVARRLEEVVQRPRAVGRARAAGPRGCSAPRRRSSRRSTAGPCPRRRGPCSSRGSGARHTASYSRTSLSVIRPGRQTWLAFGPTGGFCAAFAIARAIGPV